MTLVHDALITDRISLQKYTNKKRCKEPEIKINNFVYLSTKNLAMPKGRANKLVPKYVGLYKVTKAIPSMSNYKLELLIKLIKQWIHKRFHMSLLRPHSPNNNALFPNRRKAQPYDFGLPDKVEWYVNKIISHHWTGRKIEFLVKWNLGDSTWEPLTNCNELEALNNYLMLNNVKNWWDLPKRVTVTSQRKQ